jgi:Tol biopolymer transport system component
MTHAADPLDQLRPALADRYAVVRELGRGGMATVYLARDERHGRAVAIKVMRPELAALLGAERFLAEIRTTATLQHPHILSLFDSGAVGATVFYVMPFVDGESLRDLLARERQLPVADAVRIAREVADALMYAHSHGVIHRDIKPENILLQGGHALVADFGIALAASRTGGARLTETGMSLGTPHYMSPEQAMGERDLDARSDVYALGCVLYEMLVGEPPFTGPSAQSIVAKVLTEPAPRVRTRRPLVPESVDDAIATALEKLPADRMRSAEAFGAALDASLVSTGRTASAPTRRRSVLPLVAAATLAVLASLASLALGNWFGASRAAPPLAFGRDTHVTWDPALEVTPVLSPDGKMVAYAGGQITSFRIMVRAIGAGRAQPLTGDTTAMESNPQWTSDGSRVLFLARGGVYSAPAGGGPARAEVPGDPRAPVGAAALSNDGKRLAFARGDTLFVRDGNAPPHSVARMAQPTLCAWAPNDRFVACTSGNAQYSLPGVLFANRAPSQVVLWRASDNAVVPVTDVPSLNASPTWSADARWLYFISDRDGPRDLYGIRLGSDGHPSGAPVRLTTGLNAHTAALSANGQRLAYSRFSIRSSIWTMPMPVHPPAMTTGAVRVTNANENIEVFDVSADGRWLYYDSDLSGNSDIFRLRTGGGEPEQLTTDPADDFAPSLSPDGTEFVFHSWRTGNREIFVQRLDGGGVTQVTHTPRQPALPDWSPDGRAIAFGDLGVGNGIGIVRRDAAGHWTDPAWRISGGNRPAWTADGRQLAYITGPQGGDVRVIGVDAGESRLFVDASAPGAPLPVNIIAGKGDTLYYETIDGPNGATIWSITTAGGAPRALVNFDRRLHPPTRGSFRIKNGRLYFLAQTRESDVWAMEVKRR